MLTLPDIVRGRETSVKQIVVAQLGARQDYTIPIALQNLGYLQQFYTDVYLSPREAQLLRYLSWMQRLKNPVNTLLSRHSGDLNFDQVTRFNRLGWSYWRSLQRATTTKVQYQAFLNYGKAFNHAILGQGLSKELSAATHVYGFDHAALPLFQWARSQGMGCILDQIYPALYEEQLEQTEEDRWQGWALHPRHGFYASSIFQAWREQQIEEWQLADTILVASQYSHQAITNLNPDLASKLRVVPLTVNINAYLPVQRVRHYKGDRPLRVLFAGTVNLRKGIPDLLMAFQQLHPSEATLVVAGQLQICPEKIVAFQDWVTFLGAVPHKQMPHIYQSADLFVFPTISDGFGAVMLEAMATGLPVIATDHCGDIVEDGVNGYRIPIRQPAAIAEKIMQLRQNPGLLTYLSQGAIATSQQFSLNHYQTRLAHALNLQV